MKNVTDLLIHPFGSGKTIGGNRYKLGWGGASAQYSILAIYNDARRLLNGIVTCYDTTALDDTAVAVARLGSAVSFYSWINSVSCSYPLSDAQQKVADRQEVLAQKEMGNAVAQLNAVINNGKPINIVASIDYSNGITPSFVLANGGSYWVSWCFDDGHDATFCSYDALAASNGWAGHTLVKGDKIAWKDQATVMLSKMRQLQFSIIHFGHVPENVKVSTLHASIISLAQSLMDSYADLYIRGMRKHGITLLASELAWNGDLITLNGFPLSEHMIPSSAR